MSSVSYNTEGLDELKPCEKCGGQPVIMVDTIIEDAGWGKSHLVQWIKCRQCGYESKRYTSNNAPNEMSVRDAAFADWNKNPREGELVKTRDLQVGHIYVTKPSLLHTLKEGYKCTYLYLGKTDSGYYAWLNIGYLKGCKTEKDIYELINHWATYKDFPYTNLYFEWTTQNKKIYTMSYWRKWNSFKFDMDSPYVNLFTEQCIIQVMDVVNVRRG